MDEVFGPFPARDEFHKAPDRHVVEFEPYLESPFMRSVGAPYVISDPRDGRPFGMCPLCNNAIRAKLDAALMQGNLKEVEAYGFSRREVGVHLHHTPRVESRILETMVRLGDEIEAFAKSAAAEPESPRVASILKTVDKVTDRAADALARAARGEADAIPLAATREPRVPRHEDGYESRVRNSTYAFDGGRQMRPLRPWTIDRTQKEAIVAAEDTINFMDEMLDARKKAREVYKLIIDEGDPKYYSTAIAAVREIRTIATDLAKVSLIAKRLSDGTEGHEKSRLSPEMEAIVGQIMGPSGALPAPQRNELAEAAQVIEDGFDDDVLEPIV